jgi:general nucleoside transport system permease protein
MTQVDWSAFAASIFTAAIRRGTPMAYAAIGEALAERSGVMNLGVEGMMLVGAVTAVALQIHFDQPLLSVLGAALAAGLLAAIHAFLVLRVGASQIVSGIALTLLGTGISGVLGRPLVGLQMSGLDRVRVPWLADVPFIGRILFNQDALVYASIITAALAWLLLYRTQFGLWLRAVGEDPAAAHAQGVPVTTARAIAVILGGCLAGVGGAHLAIAYTHLWAEKMTAGQGWIAVGLVIVAGWHPMRSIIAAWTFGALQVIHTHLQAVGFDVSPYLVAMLPYVVSIVALTAATWSWRNRGYGIPAALGRLVLPGRAS